VRASIADVFVNQMLPMFVAAIENSRVPNKLQKTCPNGKSSFLYKML
jgi:hypothetical protein